MPETTSIISASTPVPAHALALSDHAEDVLADAVGHSIQLVSDEKGLTTKTVAQVLSEMVDKPDELAITLEYGTGESGVDQASWNIEITALQRAFMRMQKQSEITALNKQLEAEFVVALKAVDPEMTERTQEFMSLVKLFERPQVTRQEIDDYQHRIFGRDTYLNYLESVLSGTDPRRLFNAASNLKQVAQQLEADFHELVDPEKIDNEALAQKIIDVGGDMDKLAIELERDYASAVFRQTLLKANNITNILSQDFLKQYKLWVHSFDLNMREVLATEKSATNGPISKKYHQQLKDLLANGKEQMNQILEVIG